MNTRNVVIGIGAFTCGRWVALVLAFVLRRAIDVIAPDIASGMGTAMLTRSLVASLPDAVGAAVSGIAAALLVDSTHPARWVWLPAAAWMLILAEDALVLAPTWIVAATQVVTAALPAMVCIAAGRMAVWHRERR